MEDNLQQTVLEQYARIAELEKTVRKKDREIGRLQSAVEQEKVFANAQSNQLAVQTMAQRVRDHYLRLLLNNSPDIIICFDTTGRIVFCSDTLLKLAGRPGDYSANDRRIHEVLDGCEVEFIETLTDNLFGIDRQCYTGRCGGKRRRRRQ